MEKWLILAALGALSIWMWIVGGRIQPAPRRARAAPRSHARTAPAGDGAEPRLRRTMQLSRCARCGAYRVEGVRCHDSRGYPRG